MQWNQAEFGKRMRMRRAELGLTRRDVAASCGISADSIGRFETAKDGTPTVRTLFAVAAALDVDPRELFDWGFCEDGGEDAS